MKVIGATESLATSGTAKGKLFTRHYVFNTAATAQPLTVRNAADDGNVGIIMIPIVGGLEIVTVLGQGFLGPTTTQITPIAASGT